MHNLMIEPPTHTKISIIKPKKEETQRQQGGGAKLHLILRSPLISTVWRNN